MKKYFVSLVIAIATLSLTACGETAVATSTTPEISEEVEDTTEYVDFEGEGESQGIEKSEEELEALEAEASEYSSGEDYDTTVIESKEEVAEETTEYEKPWYGPLGTSDYKAENYPYVSPDDFWISEDQFDLKGWVLANGGFVNYYSLEYDKQEEEDETTTMYKCTFLYRKVAWHILIGETQGFNLDRDGESNTGFMYMSNGDSSVIKYNEYGCCTYKDIIEALDDTVKQIKENPEGPINEPSIN